MFEFKAEDIHISLYNTERKGSWDTNHYDRGVTVIHLPTGTKVSVDRHKSQHKNRHEATIILKDLLTPFKTGDTVFTEGGLLVIDDSIDYDSLGCGIFTFKSEPVQQHESEVAHTKEGYRYKNLLILKEHLEVLENGYYNDRDILMEEIKLLEESL